ncbi:hypothetical protein BJ165DRAFT_1469215 [Panaeolus papilionaceus]|nr:hypothetical protein BJ165DRAFT_1469215 [Panaeolus papilionaceus]
MSTLDAPEQLATRVPVVAAPLDESRTIWREFTNRNGRKYRVGYEIPADEDFEEAKKIVQGFKDSDPDSSDVKTSSGGNHHIQKDWAPYQHHIDVYWTYHDGVYYSPSQQVKDKVNITEYQLGWNHAGYYNYRLTISCNVAWSYNFYDQDGYGYGLNVNCTWWRHAVCFDTVDNKEPIITKIYAERWAPPPGQ